MLSRNKTIKLLHQITGEPYRVCRAKLKANGWNIARVTCPDFYALADMINSLRDAFTNSFKCLLDAVTSIDFKAYANALSNIIEEAKQ